MADPASLRKIGYSPAPFSTWLGVVLLFMLFGIIVLAVIGPSPRGSDYEQARAKKRVERLKTLREESEKELTTYAWVDKNKGVARISINRAMELEVAELAQKKPAPAGPIATPPPAQTSPGASASPTVAASVPIGSPKASAAPPSPAAQQAPSPPASPTPASTP
jgi:hypothetical protein